MISGANSISSAAETHSHTLLYNLAILKEKVQQLQQLISLTLGYGPTRQETATVMVSGASMVIQEIIVAASSMMYAVQQLSLGQAGPAGQSVADDDFSGQATSEVVDHAIRNNHSGIRATGGSGGKASSSNKRSSSEHKIAGLPSLETGCDVVELDAAELLAKYAHYCQVCGKGFKRDANLRMHMRAHGDKYKTNAALARDGGGEAVAAAGHMGTCSVPARKYSCPHEGCRWNQKHAKFQPLKSFICVKNHYKRSHCPKMYVCKRCNRKHFSVLSDLRTHEKHCGELNWLCSCGTTFSRKDKLMGHIALFIGHEPVVDCLTKQGRGGEQSGMEIDVDGEPGN